MLQCCVKRMSYDQVLAHVKCPLKKRSKAGKRTTYISFDLDLLDLFFCCKGCIFISSSCQENNLKFQVLFVVWVGSVGNNKYLLEK